MLPSSSVDVGGCKAISQAWKGLHAGQVEAAELGGGGEIRVGFAGIGRHAPHFAVALVEKEMLDVGDLETAGQRLAELDVDAQGVLKAQERQHRAAVRIDLDLVGVALGE